MTNTTHVLMLEDDADYENLVTAALSGAGSRFEVTPTRTLAEGLGSIERLQPDVILVDLNLPDSSGYPTFLRVQERAAGKPTIVLTGLDDDAIAIRAVEDGAQDYLVKTFVNPSLLARSIQIALSRHGRECGGESSRRRPVVLGFIGSKGGVGTSTTAVNVAAWVAHSGCDTGLLELQPGPGSSVLYMQEQPAQDLNSLLAQSPETITAADVEECAKGLCGVRWLYAGELVGCWRPLDADHVTTIIAAARRLCSCVILDLPPRVDEGVAAALRVCDRTVLVVDREPASVHHGAEMLRQIRIATSGQAQVDVVVVDRACLGNRFQSSDLRNELRMEPLITMRPAAAAICSSLAAKTPLVILYPEEGFSRNIHELAERLMAPYGESWRFLAASAAPDYGSFWRSLQAQVCDWS